MEVGAFHAPYKERNTEQRNALDRFILAEAGRHAVRCGCAIGTRTARTLKLSILATGPPVSAMIGDGPLVFPFSGWRITPRPTSHHGRGPSSRRSRQEDP